MNENLLAELLHEHLGHRVEIAAYGDPSCPTCFALEDLDTNEVIFDSEVYDLTGVDEDEDEDDDELECQNCHKRLSPAYDELGRVETDLGFLCNDCIKELEEEGVPLRFEDED